MVKSGRLSYNLSIFLMLLCAFALGIKNFSEPDLWWQLRTGEWILSHHDVPRTDPFSYTLAGTPWINIKWGFEVIIALLSSALGPESIYILQSFAAVLIFYFLFKLSRFLLPVTAGYNAVYLLSLVLAFLPAAYVMEYRFNGRPEMVTYVLTAVFLYRLTLFRTRPTRKIFMLIPLQLIWANMHEAYATGIVIIFLFLAGALVEKKFRFNIGDSRKQVSLLAVTCIGSLAAIVVNPYGLSLLTRPFNIFNQVRENKYTTELLSITDTGYWTGQTTTALFLFVITLCGILYFSFSKKHSKEMSLLRTAGPGYLMTVLAFLFLALNANRNIIFLVIALFPLLCIILFRYFDALAQRKKTATVIPFALPVLLPALFYILIVSNSYYTLVGSKRKFGLEITSYNNPTGAADFIERKGLKDKSCFSDYLTSSYLLWKLQPGFRTFIDLRDLDIFPPEHFRKFLEATASPPKFLALDSLYHFDYVVLFRPEFRTLHAYLYNDSLYACTFVDAVAAVYEKTDAFTRDDIFSNCVKVKTSDFAMAINKILNPFYVSFSYRSLDNDVIAADYYQTVVRPALAAAREQKHLQKINK